LGNDCYFIILEEVSGNQGKMLHLIKHKYVNFTFDDEKAIIFAGFPAANSLFDVHLNSLKQIKSLKYLRKSRKL